MGDGAGGDGSAAGGARSPLAYETPADAAAAYGLPHDVDWLRRVAWGWGILAAAGAAGVAWELVDFFHIRFDPRPIPRPQFETAVAWLLVGGDFVGTWWVTAREREGRRRWPVAVVLRACAVLAVGIAVADELWASGRAPIAYAWLELVGQTVALAKVVLLYTYLAAVARAAGDRWLATAARVLRIVGAAGLAWLYMLPWVTTLLWRMGRSGIAMSLWKFRMPPGVTVALFVAFEIAAGTASVWAAARVRAAVPPVARVGA